MAFLWKSGNWLFFLPKSVIFNLVQRGISQLGAGNATRVLTVD